MGKKLVTLVHYRLAYRAHILKAKLDEAGIESVVTDKTVLSAGDGVRIQVMEHDLAKAVELMKEINKGIEDSDIIEQAE